MNAGNELNIITVIGDPLLRKLMEAGLSDRAGLSVCAENSLQKAAGDAAKSDTPFILVFDDPAAGDKPWFRAALQSNPRILPLLIAEGVSGQNIFSLPLRLGALLDRIMRHHLSGEAGSAAFTLGPFIFSAGSGTLTDRKSGKIVRLTEKERDILIKLYDRRGGTVDRRELLDDIWGYAEGIETHTLETHIYRLRQKIEEDPARPLWLLTDETGYRLAL
jgi:hypothetical protein